MAGPLARVRARALVARAPLIGALVAFVVCCAGTAPAAAETTVSLSFDDGSADQMAAKQILADHGLHGTFFIIPGRVGTTRFLSWADLASIYADGNEIGGHTATHRDLTTLPPDQQRDEICGGRQELLAHGFPQLSFAYPFGHYGSTSEALVEACGYLSGRTSGALAKSPAESIPPVNRWALRSQTAGAADTVSTLEGWVLQAEAVGGGWLIIVLHHICDPAADPGCPSLHMTPADLDAFLSWLKPREPAGTHVKTIGEVISANPQPLLRVRSVRPRRNGTVRLRVYVGRSGLLRVFQAHGAGGPAARHRPRVRPISIHATHVGTLTVTIRPSSGGEAVLARKGRFKVPAEVSFTAFRGSSISEPVTMKLKKKR